MDPGWHQPWGLMVQYGGMVQTDMGMNQNQTLCGLLIVWEITESVFNGVD